MSARVTAALVVLVGCTPALPDAQNEHEVPVPADVEDAPRSVDVACEDDPPPAPRPPTRWWHDFPLVCVGKDGATGFADVTDGHGDVVVSGTRRDDAPPPSWNVSCGEPFGPQDDFLAFVDDDGATWWFGVRMIDWSTETHVDHTPRGLFDHVGEHVTLRVDPFPTFGSGENASLVDEAGLALAVVSYGFQVDDIDLTSLVVVQDAPIGAPYDNGLDGWQQRTTSFVGDTTVVLAPGAQGPICLDGRGLRAVVGASGSSVSGTYPVDGGPSLTWLVWRAPPQKSVRTPPRWP